MSATPRSLSSWLSARTACANNSSCQDAVLHWKPRSAQGSRRRYLHRPALFLLLRPLRVLERGRALLPRGLLRRHVAPFTILKAASSLVPVVVLMNQKPIARAALASLAVTHRVQSGPVGPTAPLSWVRISLRALRVADRLAPINPTSQKRRFGETCGRLRGEG